MSNVSNMPMVLSTSMKKIFTAISLGIITSGLLSSTVKAEDKEWWFDIEVIVFTRDLSNNPVAETFAQSDLLPASSDNIDLISPYLTPDLTYMRSALPLCRESSLQAQQEKHNKDFAFPEPVAEDSLSDEQTDDSVDQVTTQSTTLTTEQDRQFEAAKTNAPPEENFQYQVATTDIFGDQDIADNSQGINPALDQEGILTLGENPKNDGLSPEQVPVELLPITIDWIEWQIPKQFPCAYVEQIQPSFSPLFVDNSEEPKDILAHIQQVPTVINGVEWFDKSQAPFLLPKEQLRMTDLYTSIKKQRGISPLIHLSWRQQVTFGAGNAQGYRLFAGQNYATQFNGDGEPKVDGEEQFNSVENTAINEVYIPLEEREKLTPEELQSLIEQLSPISAEPTDTKEDLFSKIEQALQSEDIIDTTVINDEESQQNKLIAQIKQLWHVDGFMKVYLQNVGRVPYLHIDSHLDYRYVSDSPVEAGQQDSLHNQNTHLHSVRFDQLRRVISKQVHYFDHPLFGMVVTINRFNWPVENHATNKSS